MKIAIDELVRRVKRSMGLNTGRELYESLDSETLHIDEMIEQALPEAAMRVICDAPADKLDGFRSFSMPVSWQAPCGDYYGGMVPLPDDFLRLVSFRMSDWVQPVVHLTAPESVEGSLQGSREAGVRGTPEHPVCMTVARTDGWWLKFNACGSRSERIVEALYMPLPVPDVNGAIEIPRRLVGAVVAAAASLALSR